MSYKRLVAVIMLAAATSPVYAKKVKHIAIVDFVPLGEATVEQGMDVADNVRLMFVSSKSYAVEDYERMVKAVTSAKNAGLDLTTVKDITRLGKALGDDVVVTGSVGCKDGYYTVQVNFTDVKKAAGEAAYEGAGPDLRTVTEELLRKASGSEKFGVLFPDAVNAEEVSKAIAGRKAMKVAMTPQELAIFDAVSRRGKSMMLDKFWLRRDPDPYTPANEFREEFWSRYDYVQQHFTNPIREGIETDRGRIYLLYGPPTEIEDFSGGRSSIMGENASTWTTKPYYAWKYYGAQSRSGRNMLFLFVDQIGDDEYTLYASTEPGYGRVIRNYNDYDANRLTFDDEDRVLDSSGSNYWDPSAEPSH